MIKPLKNSEPLLKETTGKLRFDKEDFLVIFDSLVRVVWRLIKKLLTPSVKSVWKS